MPFFLVPTQQGRTIPLDKPIVFFGRHPECDVVLTRSRKVSRKHCCIAQVNETFFIRDLGSMNGIRVNGKRIQREARLNPGDEVAVGDVVYRLQAQNGAAHPGGERSGSAAKPVKVRPAARRTTAAPVELSQEFPVAIPEDEEFDENRETPDAMPVAEAPPPDDDGDDEVIELGEDDVVQENDEFPNRGPRR